MKAVRRRGSDVYLDPDCPEPEPRAGEVLIRTRLAGVGANDLAVVRGDNPFEGVLGHRFVGVVDALGAGVDAKWKGARVVGNINIAPPSSELARRGLGQHAPDRRVLGLVGKDGCFAERFTLPVANLARVPDPVPDEGAVFGEPLAGAVHASRIVRLEGKGFVTVIGDNLPALLCAQVMEPMNNSVRLLGRRPDRYELAERWGVRHRNINEVGLRNDQDVVIVCTGEPEDLALALGMVRPRGKIVLKAEPTPLPGIGAPAPDSPRPAFDLAAIVRDEIELYGARCGSVGEAMGVLSSGRVDVSNLITKRVRFDDAIAGLRAAGEASQIMVVLEF